MDLIISPKHQVNKFRKYVQHIFLYIVGVIRCITFCFRFRISRLLKSGHCVMMGRGNDIRRFVLRNRDF